MRQGWRSHGATTWPNLERGKLTMVKLSATEQEAVADEEITKEEGTETPARAP